MAKDRRRPPRGTRRTTPTPGTQPGLSQGPSKGRWVEDQENHSVHREHTHMSRLGTMGCNESEAWWVAHGGIAHYWDVVFALDGIHSGVGLTYGPDWRLR